LKPCFALALQRPTAPFAGGEQTRICAPCVYALNKIDLIYNLNQMSIFNIYSKRQKLLRQELPDIFTYTSIPSTLKVQIVHLLRDTIGRRHYSSGPDKPGKAYSFINDILCREYGVFALDRGYSNDPELSVLNQLQNETDIEKILDIVELCFKYIDKIIKPDDNYSDNTVLDLTPDEAISDLNDRFKEHAIGYQFESGEIIRVDSTYVHAEITRPTLELLRNDKFTGANEEYLKAHEHYRHGRNKECLTECLKAFESTMKIVCSEKGWAFNQTDTASKLIKICFDNNLVPSFTQNQFSSLQNLLLSGIPTIRNKVGGHGQGQVPQIVDDGMTRYGLNLTGTNIIFLIEQSEIK
jgi:hypothetical protein